MKKIIAAIVMDFKCMTLAVFSENLSESKKDVNNFEFFGAFSL